MKEQRIADYPIEPLFLRRWSPRAYDAVSMDPTDLFSILEAARWAPSAYNIQPWRFLYSLRDDSYWKTYLSLLDPFNAGWAQHASALVFIISDQLTPPDGDGLQKTSLAHSFDSGAAWAQLALQATSIGYQAHAMAGIDHKRSRNMLSVPAHYQVEVAIAIGKSGDPSSLSEELKDREYPSLRRRMQEITFSGVFPS